MGRQTRGRTHATRLGLDPQPTFFPQLRPNLVRIHETGGCIDENPLLSSFPRARKSLRTSLQLQVSLSKEIPYFFQINPVFLFQGFRWGLPLSPQFEDESAQKMLRLVDFWGGGLDILCSLVVYYLYYIWNKVYSFFEIIICSKQKKNLYSDQNQGPKKFMSIFVTLTL